MAAKATTTRGATAKPATAAVRQTAEQDKALDLIFADLQKSLAKYAPPFDVHTDEWGGYHLWSTTPTVVEGRKRNEMYFAGAVQRKGYVAFHYMPVYAQPDLQAIFKPELLSLLKGRSCFQLKRRDPVVMRQVDAALAIGYRKYKQRGWV